MDDTMLLDLLLLFCQCQQKMSMSLKDVIKPVQDEVKELLETKYGLLTRLLESGVITPEHKAAVEVILPDVCLYKILFPVL